MQLRRNPWPDLERLARIEKRRREGKVVAEMREKLKTQLGAAGDFLQKWLEMKNSNSNAEALIDDEDEFVEHLRTCPNCKKHVADLARAGVKLSARVLSAAGVEMLN